jgi:DNA-binding NarL/FixJ family response regulator
MRIVIVEDSVLLREGIVRLLGECDHDVVGQLGDVAGLVEMVGALRPDLVVLDVRLPPTFTDEGIRAARAVRAAAPTQPIVVLSQYVEERYATDLLADGSEGLGYLLKERVADVGDFVDACVRVASGGTVLDPEVVAQLLARRQRGPLDSLTPREREVLGLMAEGRSNAGVAAQLVVSEGAVEKHISSIFAKLGLATSDTEHRRVLAVLQYVQHG